MKKRIKKELLRIIEQLQARNEEHNEMILRISKTITREAGAGLLMKFQRNYRAKSNLLGDLIDEINNIRKKTYPRWIQKLMWW